MAGQSKVETLPPWGNAVAGAAGAVIANTLVYPLDLIKTRLQVQVKRSPNSNDANPADGEHYDGALDALQKVFAEEGLAGLYAGIGGSLLGVASTNFAYFYWYTVVRSLYMANRTLQASPSTPVELSLGALAGALAQLFTIPVAVVTTRQQTMSKAERKGMIATAMDVVNGAPGAGAAACRRTFPAAPTSTPCSGSAGSAPTPSSGAPTGGSPWYVQIGQCCVAVRLLVFCLSRLTSSSRSRIFRWPW